MAILNIKIKTFFHKINLRKTVCLCVIFASVFCTKLFAIGAGVQLGTGPSIYNIFDKQTDSAVKIQHFENITGTIRFFRIPAVVGFGLETGVINDTFAFGVSGFADYWLLNFQIKNNWNFYGGAGISGEVLLSAKSDFLYSVGARAFCGVDAVFFDNFVEFYVQLTANPCFLPEFLLKIPVETGIRFHF